VRERRKGKKEAGWGRELGWPTTWNVSDPSNGVNRREIQEGKGRGGREGRKDVSIASLILACIVPDGLDENGSGRKRGKREKERKKKKQPVASLVKIQPDLARGMSAIARGPCGEKRKKKERRKKLSSRSCAQCSPAPQCALVHLEPMEKRKGMGKRERSGELILLRFFVAAPQCPEKKKKKRTALTSWGGRGKKREEGNN